MKRLAMAAVLLTGLGCANAQTRQLKATADAWVSAFRDEVTHSAGRHKAFKLKTIQELATIRDDPHLKYV